MIVGSTCHETYDRLLLTYLQCHGHIETIPTDRATTWKASLSLCTVLNIFDNLLFYEIITVFSYSFGESQKVRNIQNSVRINDDTIKMDTVLLFLNNPFFYARK